MANDGRPNEHEEEREFLAGLKARTGRDLAEWMAAIAAQGFSDKNQIIDWLRTQGLPFARASWLERIHRNGGKPIYAGGGGVTAQARAAAQPAQPPAPAPPTPAKPAPAKSAPAESAAPRPAPEQAARKATPAAEPSADTASLEKLISAAKGYRPLYQHLEAQIRRAIPGAVVSARDRYVSIGAPREFAAITPHPTEIRLGLDLGDRPFDAQLQKAKLRGPGPGISHMVVLTDARQVNDSLLALVKLANARANASE